MKTDVRTRGAIAASLLVGVYLVAQSVLGVIGALAAELHYQPGYAGLGAHLQSAVLDLFLRTLPIVVGVFVSLRLIAPISAELTLVSVLLRSLIAAAAGAALAFLVGGVFAFLSSFTGNLFGNSFPFEAFGDVVGAMLSAIVSAIGDFFGLVPLIALAAVLLWIWLRRREA
jgi:hypothetical protein